MTNRTPLRFTILHFAHLLRIDGDTFISFTPCSLMQPQTHNYNQKYTIRPLIHNQPLSADDRLLFQSSLIHPLQSTALFRGNN